MNNFSPKKIKDGFLLRWSQQTLELVVRNPLVWIIYLTSLFFISLIPIPIYINFIISSWLIILGFNIIAFSDSKIFTLSDFLQEIKISFIDFYHNINIRILTFTSFIICLFIVTQVFKPTPIDITKLNFNSIFFPSFIFFFLGFLNLSPASNLYYHYFRKFFNTDDKLIIMKYCYQGIKLNFRISLFFFLYVLFNVLICSMLLPILILIIAPLTLGFVYLSFREIFLDIDNNIEIVENIESLPMISLK